MVCKAAWIPSRGTVLVGESNEPCNPTDGALSFTSLSPSEQAAQESAHERGDQAPAQPTSASGAELIQEHAAPLESLLNIASMCNVAKVFQGEEGWMARGDPTECAIQVFAHRFDWGRQSLTDGDSPRWSEWICDRGARSRADSVLPAYRAAPGVPFRLGPQAHVGHLPAPLGRVRLPLAALSPGAC